MTQPDLRRFERVVMPHLDDAYSLARHLLRDEHDAQDVAQDAVLRAWRYFESYSGGDARAWLLAIVRNCAMTWQRQHRVDAQRLPLAALDELQTRSRDEADTRAVEESERRRVERAVDALPDEFREVILLREVQALSYRDISDVVGVPIGTVMSRLARARKRLAALLGIEQREVG